ncbi:hypothetical protein GXB81_28630 [Paraburkholderia sp. Ac-20336]|uniref:phage tail tip lysozyme n=1 Tax=Burkholderiaceae TaxID=119060 RepID=UPI00141FA923|nr:MULTISPECIES: phage tail tip lysozyme [Burkholderiaceae]MBN3806981.1 hypothetical protein [Paraburkholderia sp. Ac-20336]MBN3845949.1 hypothetical protein [Paraburkholderia sp. Ac-20342]
MSTTAIQGSVSPFMTDLGGVGGTDNSQLEQFLEALIQELQQILMQMNGGSDDSGSGPSGIGSTPPASMPQPQSFAPPPTGGGGSGGGGGGPSGSGATPAVGAPSSGGGGGGSSSGGSVPNVSGGSAAQAITQNLEQTFGLTATQAAGVLGNLQQESGLQGNVNQGGATGAPSSNFADDNNNGWGLAQWGGPRKQGEIDYAQQHGLDPGSLQANLGFMDQELKTDYSKTITDIKGTSTAEQAALVWDKDYEQATDPEMSNRNKYAEEFLSQGL